MNTFKRTHRVIAGILFVVAIMLYVVGFRSEAVGASILAVVVEIAAWIVLAKDRSEQSPRAGRRSTD